VRSIKPPAAPEHQLNGKAAASPQRSLTGLARELVVILTIKVVVLFAIWWMWFSAPQARHMQMPTGQVDDRVIKTPASPVARPADLLTSGNHDHAAR